MVWLSTLVIFGSQVQIMALSKLIISHRPINPIGK